MPQIYWKALGVIKIVYNEFGGNTIQIYLNTYFKSQL